MYQNRSIFILHFSVGWSFFPIVRGQTKPQYYLEAKIQKQINRLLPAVTGAKGQTGRRRRLFEHEIEQQSNRFDAD
jgi:hypothetical protein